MRKQIVIIIAGLLVAAQAGAAVFEGLDELTGDVRKNRRATNTYYSGESAGNGWNRQSESVMYTDSITGREVWILSSTANRSTAYYTDISPANPWSADGKWLGFFSSRLISEFTRISGSSLNGHIASTFTVNTDGSHLRAAYDSSERTYSTSGAQYFYWNPAIRDTYYTTGGRFNGQSLDASAVYKDVVTDSGTTFSKLVDLPGGDSDYYGMKKVISPDGKYLLPKRNGIYYPVQVYPESGASLKDSDGWAEYRGQLYEWAATTQTISGCRHDIYFPSPDYYVILFSNLECSGIGPQVWKYNVGGTDTDGGPDYVNSETSYSTFNAFETEPMWTWGSAPVVPWKLAHSVTMHGWGHPGFDRWGRVVIYGDGNGFWDDGGVHEYGGPVAWDYKNRQLVAEPSEHTYPKVLIESAKVASSVESYMDYNAWSDWFAMSTKSAQEGDNYIFTGRYDLTHDQGNPWYKAFSHHGNQNVSTDYNYTMNARIAQSPDGTKVSFASTILTNSPNTGDIAWGVAYYPHPPEITSVTDNSGTYTVRFDWRLATASPRGYTTRGWPVEGVNNPPPPRETKLFTLWRSSTGTGGWVPVATTDASIFERYNFQTGVWTGNDYWTITDTPGAGTFYYAVTAREQSGLESRTLSNVFSAAGMQTAAYPSDPKGSSHFITSYNASMVRAYNIYAQDGLIPSEGKATLIATIPAAYTSWVDWLGDTDGSTKYKVTAIDFQGNESTPLVTTFAHRATQGQYDVSWTAEIAPEPVCDNNHANLCTQTQCATLSLYYWDGLCHSYPQPATCDSTHLGLCPVGDCATAGGYWYNETCNATAEIVCGPAHREKCVIGDCVPVGEGFWYDNACHDEAAPTPGARVRYRPSGSGPTKAIDN